MMKLVADGTKWERGLGKKGTDIYKPGTPAYYYKSNKSLDP